MSFLTTELLKKKKTLKSTQTVVTRADGHKYIEDKDKITMLSDNSYGFVVDTKPDNVPAKIVDHVYLGSQDCCQLEVLQENSIKNVLSVGIDAPVKYDDVNYKFVQCLDLPDSNIVIVIQECVEFIREYVEKKSNVLVHCNAGVSRSSSVAIGYLMLVNKLSYTQAFNVVKTARPCVQPNPGFVKQLQGLNTLYK